MLATGHGNHRPNPNNLLLIGEAACCLLYDRSVDLSLQELGSSVPCCEFYYERVVTQNWETIHYF